MGSEVGHEGGLLTIDTPADTVPEVRYELVEAVGVVLGPLVGRLGGPRVSLAGADQVVSFTAKLDANGRITRASAAATDVYVDITGYYTTPTLGSQANFWPMTPAGVADTRAGVQYGVCDGAPCSTLAAVDEVHVAVAGQGGVPADAAAAVVNISVWNPAGDGLAFVARDPASFNSAAAVFYTAGEDTSMAAVLPVAEDGTVSVLATTAIDLTIDVVGVFIRPVDTFTYTYDSTGLRTAKQADGASPVEFSWGRAGGLPLLLAQHRGAAGTSYLVYGPGGTPIYQIRADGSPLYLHQDHLGSTRLVTASNGNPYGTMTYDAYGKVLTNTTPWYLERPLLTYAGQYTDTETGFQYLRARYHDPATGQFLTRDPLTHQAGQPYSYAGGDPVNRIDPSGLCPWHSPLDCISPVLDDVAEGASDLGGAIWDAEWEYDWGTAAAGVVNVGYGINRVRGGTALLAVAPTCAVLGASLGLTGCLVVGAYQTVTGGARALRGFGQLLEVGNEPRADDAACTTGDNVERLVKGVTPGESLLDKLGGTWP